MTDIKAFEDMAKLDLPEDERLLVSERAALLFESFEAIENADVSSAAALVSVLDIENVFREDVPVKTVSREALLANAPEQSGGYFQVPRTID